MEEEPSLEEEGVSVGGSVGVIVGLVVGTVCTNVEKTKLEEVVGSIDHDLASLKVTATVI